MAFTANTDALRTFGENLRRLPGTAPAPAPGELPEDGGLLSEGLAGLHNGKMRAADRFRQAKDGGTTAAGTSLGVVADGISNIDGTSGNAIRQASSDPATGSGGGV